MIRDGAQPGFRRLYPRTCQKRTVIETRPSCSSIRFRYSPKSRSIPLGVSARSMTGGEQARVYAIRNVESLRLPFRKPLLDDLALFWPERGRPDLGNPVV